MKIKRRESRQVMVGNVPVGGGAPIAIQTMTKAKADDVEGTLNQISTAASLGCDIIRVAVPTVRHVDVFGKIVSKSALPVVADIHFDWRIALGAVEAGAAKIRINPGNMNDWDGLEKVITSAKDRGIPIRIGLNSGSVRHKNSSDNRPMTQALAEEALSYAERFEDLGFSDIVISLKAASVIETVAANRYVAERCYYPLHIGVTAAGPEDEAIIRSAIGIGALLMDGIGDTIRLSFTGSPASEVTGAKKLLRAAGILKDGPHIVSCPTCGRCSVDLLKLVEQVRERLKSCTAPATVAVMGCEVNGPGEAKDADIGIAASGGRMALFSRGEKLGTFTPEEAVDKLLEKIMEMYPDAQVSR